MSDVIKLSGVGVDCPDAGELAAFYAEITGGTVTSQNERWASMSGPGEGRDRLRPPQVVTKRPCEQGLLFASYRRECVEVVID